MTTRTILCCSLVLGSVGLAASPSRAQLPFIEDDFEAARAQSQQRQVPLFVEVGAPW